MSRHRVGALRADLCDAALLVAAGAQAEPT